MDKSVSIWQILLTSSSRRHDSLHSGECQTEDTGYTNFGQSILLQIRGSQLTKGIVDTDNPSHSLLTLNVGEYFGGVLEGDRPLTQRIANRKEVDEADRGY